MTDEPMSEAEVRESFSRQGFNVNLGATLNYIAPGEVHVGIPYAVHLPQQNGFVHAGVIASIATTPVATRRCRPPRLDTIPWRR